MKADTSGGAGRPGLLRPRLRPTSSSAPATTRRRRRPKSLWWLSESGVRFGVARDDETLRALGLTDAAGAGAVGGAAPAGAGTDAVEVGRAGAPRHPADRYEPCRVGGAASEAWIRPPEAGTPPAVIKPENDRPADAAESAAAGGQAVVAGGGRRAGDRPAGRHGRHDRSPRGARTFNGAGSIFPIFMIGGIGDDDVRRPFRRRRPADDAGKLDAMRAQFMLMLDVLRERVSRPPTAWTPTTAGITRRSTRWPPRWVGRGCGNATPTARTPASVSPGSGWA